MCMYIHIYTYIYGLHDMNMHSCIYTHIYIYIHYCIYIYIYAYTCTCIYTYIYTYTYICTYVYTLHIHTYVHVHIGLRCGIGDLITAKATRLSRYLHIYIHAHTRSTFQYDIFFESNTSKLSHLRCKVDYVAK